MGGKKLTAEQEVFCQTYLEDSNATASYQTAYPKVARSTAGTEGHKLLKKPEIWERIEFLRSQRINRVEVKQDDVLLELLRIGKLDPRLIYNEQGEVRPPSEWPDEVAACISGMDRIEKYDDVGNLTSVTWKVRFWPKVQSLELLGKYLKLFTDKTEVSLSKTLEDLVAGSREEK